MDIVQIVIAVCMGLALSAACGFRVFVPMLIAGLAVRFGGLTVSDSFAWAGGDAALICLGAATVLEIIAYYIPYVDNLLDTISTPLALVAGTLIMSGMLVDMPPYLQWGLAIVGGAGSAGAVQAGTAALRGASTATTGGMGNCVVSTGENAMATGGALLAIFAPVLAFIGLLVIGYIAYRIIRRLRRRKERPAIPA